MPRLLNSAVGQTGTTGTNTYFITLENTQPSLGITPSTSTGYTLVTQGPLKQLVWTNTLGDVAFTDGFVYRNTANADFTLSSTGTGRLNLTGNVHLNGQQLVVTTGTFTNLTVRNLTIDNLFANTASIANLTATNIFSVASTATFGTFKYLSVDTATVYESLVTFGSATLSPVGKNVSISPSGGGTVYINPASLGLINNMIIGLNVPRNGYFTNLTADTLTLNQPIIISTGSFDTIQTNDLTVNSSTNLNNLFVNGKSTLTNLTVTGLTQLSTADVNTLTVDLLTATNIISTSATIIGSLYAGSLYDSGNRVITEVTVSAGTGLAGGGTINGTSGTVILTNTGVLSIIAGTDTSISSSTGDVLIWNSSTLQSVTDRGATTTNAITIANTTSATSTTTGALIVSGGVGISGDVHANGDVYSEGGSPYYNRLLYTPKVTVNATPPLSPRIGDFWIDPTVGVEYQLVPNGTSTIWIQFIGF